MYRIEISSRSAKVKKKHSSFNMFVVNVIVNGINISSEFMEKMNDVQTFALDWSKNKHNRIGRKILFDEFRIFVYDISKPQPHDYVDIPKAIFY